MYCNIFASIVAFVHAFELEKLLLRLKATPHLSSGKPASSLFTKFACVEFSLIIWILGLQPRDKAAMLVVNTKEIFLLNLHQNRVHFPAERNAFVLDHQHGRRDVTCKPAMGGKMKF